MKRSITTIDMIVCHHSASDNPRHCNIETIREWHLARNFNDVGYHFFIQTDGTIQKGRELNIVGAHARKFNQKSIGICLGGLHIFTIEQKQSLAALCYKLCSELKIEVDRIVRHKDLAKTECCHYEIDSIKKLLQSLL